jgi:hypothetical protein
MVRNPSNAQLADCLGIRKPLEQAVYDLAIVGAGPAGLKEYIWRQVDEVFFMAISTKPVSVVTARSLPYGY